MTSQKKITAKWKEIQNKNIVLDEDLKKKLQTELIFIASNFEGLHLTHEEAESVVNNPKLKIDEKNKSLLQARGQKIALDFAEEYAKKDQPIDIYLIKDIHRIILGESWEDIAGKYRKEAVEFKKTRYLPPHHSKVAEEMYLFDKWLASEQEQIRKDDFLSVLKFAAETFHQLTKIHPFRDGNGRVARIVFNLICRKYNLPYVLIPKSGKEEKFLKALEKADFGESEELLKVMASFILKSFDIMLKERV